MKRTSPQIDWDRIRARLHDGEQALGRAMTEDRQRVDDTMRRRARMLAERGVVTAAARDGRQTVLIFTLGGERYGIKLTQLAQIVPLNQCTPIPAAPDALIGIINQRGEPVCVIDLANILGLTREENDDNAGGYVLLLRHNRHRAGVRVDGVQHVEHLSPDDVTPTAGSNIETPFARGVTRDGVILLDLDAVFQHELFQSNGGDTADRLQEQST